MQKLFDFVNKYGYMILLLLLLISFQHGCFVDRKFKKINKQLHTMQQENDSLINQLSVDMTKLIHLEGLETELRLIEATDRTLLDVERQYKIREEIKKMGELVSTKKK